MTTDGGWPDSIQALAARFARPCRDYENVVAFYAELLGLPVIGSFTDQDGYDGTIFGLPDTRFQLELTRQASGEPLPTPTEEDFLVIYFPTEAHRSPVLERLRGTGLEPVALTNPYWAQLAAIAYVDPDGWQVILALSAG